jgi:hypothetical protein
MEETSRRLDTGVNRVDMHVLEAGQHHATLQIRDYSALANVISNGRIRADENNPAVTYRERFCPPAIRVHRIDIAVL